MTDITVRDYRIVYRDNEEILHLPEKPGEFLDEYPESNAHGDVDAYGIWVHHADRISLENISVTPRSKNSRSKMIAYHDVN